MKNNKKRFAVLGLIIALLLTGTVVVCASGISVDAKTGS